MPLLTLFLVDPLSSIGFGDGFYIESILCIVIGLLWMKIIFPKLHHLQSLKPEDWAVPKQAQPTIKQD